ncbi:IclR family transcriptional regulator [Bacillus sp. FJAT-29814]|uniref:IclR family transcriptional regulator n=1 Tax=Bacillus sp. FJAT-29814 TaxID=1729688 RepID=UPI00082B07B7|nr:IclR family transcriptional regulator [Bacillus sp. FJAT-29814]
MEKENALSSVSNAIKILRSFKMEQPQKGVRELAAELGLGKSSVQRILATLAKEGLVRKNSETNKYELGLSVLELSSIVLGHIDLHTEALPIITKIANTFKETSHLAILDNLEIIYLCKVEGENSIKLVSHPGLHYHTHCTSSGKLLLAFSEPFLVDSILRNGLKKYTSKTITDPDMFRRELKQIYQKGYSVSNGELRNDISSLSAPVRDYTGKVIAAINLVGPSNRLSNRRVELMAPELIRSGELISDRMGYWKR